MVKKIESQEIEIKQDTGQIGEYFGFSVKDGKPYQCDFPFISLIAKDCTKGRS
jgi:hypothetical protein